MSVFEELRGNLRLTVSFVSAILFFLIIAGLLIAWRDDISLLAAVVGAALGWAAGILLAPYKVEEKRIRRLSKGIAGFLSGYAVGKFDRVFDLLLDKTGGPPAVLSLRVQRTFWVSLACFVVTTVTVFVARSYGVVAEDEADENA
jgi:cytochrome c biogenesis protein CcdA